MELAIPQLIAILIGLLFIYYSNIQFKKKIFSKSEFSFWILIWGGLIIVSFISTFIVSLSKGIIFYRILDIIFVVSIILLFGLSFRIYKKLNENEQKMKELIRKITYSESKK
jgi:hypothetical protein